MKSSSKIQSSSILSFLVVNKAYLGPPVGQIDRSLYDSLVGKRAGFTYYNIEASLLGVKHSLKVFEDIVVSGGKTLFVGGSVPLISSLLCLSFSEGAPVHVNLWGFSKISVASGIDLLFLHEVDSKSIAESQGKSIPFIGVQCSTARGIGYPIHLNIDDPLLRSWYLYAVSESYRRGLYRRCNKIHEI